MPSCQQFRDETYGTQFMQRLLGLRRDGLYADVTLKIEDETFLCHKVVLSASCAYFRAMFTSGLDESTSGKVEIKGTDAQILRSIIDYIYTAEITITTENAQRLLQACDQFRLDSLQEACENFMLQEIEPTNCIGCYKFSKLFALKKLRNGTRAEMLTKFKEIVQTSSEFKELSADELIEYIGDDELNIENENVVFDAVVQWVKHDVTGRRCAFDDIIKHVRLPFATSDYLCYVITQTDIVSSSKAARETVEEARLYHMLADKRHEMVSPRTVPRRNFSLTRHLVVLGGLMRDDRENRHCWFLNEEKSTWQLLAQMPKPNWKFYAACILQNGILITGGYHGNVKSDCWLFDTVEKKWKSFPAMTSCRCKHRAVVHSEKVYIIGGEDDMDRPLTAVEKFDCRLRQWTKAADMLTGLSDPLVHSCTGNIYVFGGISDGDQTSCQTQMYDPVWDQWSFKADMPEPCRLGAGAVVNDRIYVVGGYNQACMCYAPATDAWTLLTRPRERHGNAPAVVWRGRILLAGGDVNSSEITTVVEEYDTQQDKWSYWETGLKEELSCHYMVNVDLCGI